MYVHIFHSGNQLVYCHELLGPLEMLMLRGTTLQLNLVSVSHQLDVRTCVHHCINIVSKGWQKGYVELHAVIVQYCHGYCPRAVCTQHAFCLVYKLGNIICSKMICFLVSGNWTLCGLRVTQLQKSCVASHIQLALGMADLNRYHALCKSQFSIHFHQLALQWPAISGYMLHSKATTSQK